MANTYFQFKEFLINQDQCAMKVTTDSCLFGAWVANTLDQQRVDEILDIGTGTGLLSLMLAQKVAGKITAIELDVAAARQAEQNIRISKWQEIINVIQADFRTWLPEKKFDVIISNPPFYENELASPSGGRNVAHHAGGLLLEELFSGAAKILRPGGMMFVLLPAKRLVELDKLVGDKSWSIELKTLVYHSPKHPASRVMLMLRLHPVICTESTISIRGNDGGYSAEFSSLLSDYYLS